MELIAEKPFLDQILKLRDKIFRITKRMLISKEEAEDATQEVIVKLWEMDPNKRNSFKSMEAYSVIMAKNYCIDRLKSKQAQNLSLNDEIYMSTEQHSLIRKIEGINEMEWVSQLIDRLPERDKMIVQLREIEKYEYEEIGEILDIPPATVRVYLSRIRKKLKKEFLAIQNYGTT
ncbi:MAG: sigma-70 family RNA polymerase sigma factor [Flavobacteriaceae bacterium]